MGLAREVRRQVGLFRDKPDMERAGDVRFAALALADAILGDGK